MNIDDQVALLMQGTEYGDEELKKNMANELRQRLVDARDTQRLGAHACTQGAGADVGRHPDEADAAAGSVEWQRVDHQAGAISACGNGTASPMEPNRFLGSASSGIKAIGRPTPRRRALSRMNRSAE